MFRFIIFLSAILLVRILLFYNEPQKETYIEKSIFKESSVFSAIRGQIAEVFDKNLSRKHSTLLFGIVFGEKNLDKQSRDAFRKTGVLHVVAASGMNVSMLVSPLLALLLVFFKRQYALIICAFAIFIYTALASFQPSIVRAAIMATIALSAGIIGRQNTSLLALFFAAFIMVFWDPIIIQNIGFQLSFLATAGIILLDPVFKKLLFRNAFFEDFRTTISAQIATTPLILFFFSSYSLISIVVNLLVLWTIPPLMILGGLAAIVSLIFPILAIPILWLSIPLLAYFREVIDLFEKFAFEFRVEQIPWAIIVGYYFILLSVVFSIYRRYKISA